MDFMRLCFVIMPFGDKDVVDDRGVTRRVSFDAIYASVFEPAIGAVTLPEGGTLQARRTDRDFFTGDISQEMFEYLEYARIALTDITSLNANVFYELGVRHRARGSGTAVFRQPFVKLPFDINQIKAFPYEFEPVERVPESRALITRVLSESLVQNRIDSPVQRALAVQRTQHRSIEPDLREAENALRAGDRHAAIAACRRAAAIEPGNSLVRLRLGLLYRDDGQWTRALEEFTGALAAEPGYAEAYRERGIAENKLFQAAGRPPGAPDGLASLERAVTLAPDDYDAWSSLGGILKREGRLEEALAAYDRATEVSRGHSYPLLNAVKLRARLTGTLAPDPKTRFLLTRAERSLTAQVASEPPCNVPWCLFDLAEIRLYAGDREGFLTMTERGTEAATHGWQLRTFADSLQPLADAGIDLPGLPEGVALLRERAAFLA
ncbi:MAG: tetratricopeptide repeat protein [Vicinamibacterales bacterium]